ncbi:MAG TPA: hypothetical protein VNM90_25075 [Haliangium sp.]|nr:hypothetical protein [Haliangium sp.]
MGARARLFVSSLLGMVCLWLVGATGCGSVLYVNQVTRKASASVAAAKAAEADVYAPYHYTLAVYYLHKAREEAAAADFQAANHFGRMSHQAGEKARELAVQRSAEPGDTSWKPPPGAPGYEGPAPAADAPQRDDAGEGAGAPAGEGAGEEAGAPKGDDAGEPRSDDAGADSAEAGADSAEDAKPEAKPEAAKPGAKPRAKPTAKPKAKPGAAKPDAAKPSEDGR